MSAARFSSSSRSSESREPSRPTIWRSSATTRVDSPIGWSGVREDNSAALGMGWAVLAGDVVTRAEASPVEVSPRGRSVRAAANGESGTWCTAYFRGTGVDASENLRLQAGPAAVGQREWPIEYCSILPSETDMQANG